VLVEPLARALGAEAAFTGEVDGAARSAYADRISSN
jgi:hypothetical protein